MKKKIVYDSILNIVSTTIPIAIIQLIIYPFIAGKLGDNGYGLMITLVSLVNLTSRPFGNVLNNIRLLYNNDYEKDDLEGDFNILLTAGLAINSLAMVIGTIYYEGSFSPINVLLIILISALNLIREYMIVSFRIKLNYKHILLDNILLVLGYFVGLFFFDVTGYWQLIYLCGYLISLLFIMKNSTLIKEKLIITPLFKKTGHKSVVLLVATFLKSITGYADKLIIYPLLGPLAVSAYYSATILGKIISMGISPISSVFLSYLSNMKKINKKNFVKILLVTSITALIGYIICIIISEPVLMILYPDWASESLKLIYITTASAVIGVVCSIINPIILRFNNVNWQLIISISDIIIYIFLTIVFYNLYGLTGFCMGILISNIFKLILMICIYFFSFKKTTN